ncbi:MAG: DUF2911 domain-containing protein [Verrucomicrobia bacterium]|nr:DUF2911 domain-containing protein [Verrucomicrobiota bacterium]
MLTRYLLPALFASAAVFTAIAAHAQTPAPKIEFPAPSPAATLKQRVGLTDIEISYSRPGMKGRKVYGGLVPYNQVWRTGANSATKIKFSSAMNFGGTPIPAGTYELFSIPGEKEWTVIIHKDSSQWGAYKYDAKNDVARVTVTPVTQAAPVESFTIDIGDLRDTSATLSLNWGKVSVPVKLTVDVVTPLVPQIEALMSSDAASKPYVNAAMFYLDHGLDLTKAAAWMDAAIAAQPGATHLIYRKALVLAAAGDKAGAITTAKASIEAAKKAGGPIGDEYTKLNEELIASLR